MKRFLLFSALLLTACHASRPHFTVGVSQCSDDAWRQKMNNEMQTEALLYDNLELEIRSAGGDSERQIADIRHFIEQGVDLLIVAPNEAIPVTPVVEEAYARGIPVIVVDRKILSDHYTAYIGADNYRIGKIIGEYVASQLGGRGEVIELTGLSGSTPAIDRHQGFVNALKNHPGIRVLCSEDAHWLRSDAEVRADSLYRIYPEVDLVVTENGMACKDQLTVNEDGTKSVHDPDRIDYLKRHFAAAKRAIDEGVPLTGYFVWSLLDNFEWYFGYAKRFGITYVDYATQERIPKDSFMWYRDFLASRKG